MILRQFLEILIESLSVCTFWSIFIFNPATCFTPTPSLYSFYSVHYNCLSFIHTNLSILAMRCLIKFMESISMLLPHSTTQPNHAVRKCTYSIILRPHISILGIILTYPPSKTPFAVMQSTIIGKSVYELSSPQCKPIPRLAVADHAST